MSYQPLTKEEKIKKPKCDEHGCMEDAEMVCTETNLVGSRCKHRVCDHPSEACARNHWHLVHSRQ